MRRPVVAALAALALAFTVTPPAASAAQVGDWSFSQAREDATHVQLRFGYTDNDAGGYSRSSWSSPVLYSEAGISAERLRAPIGPVSFRIDREPGSFACTGSAGAGSGAGQFIFSPNDGFSGALEKRGMGRPTERQALQLAIAATTLAFADQLRGTSRATVADLVRIVEHGVTPRYLADLTALGFRVSGDELVRLRDHGVSADFIRAMQSAGFKNISADELVRLRDHGVSQEYVADLGAHGYKSLSAKELIRLRDHGVRASFVDDLARNGYKNLSADDLVTLRDHGVSVAFIERLKAHGYANVSVRDLVRLRDSGI